MKIYVGYQCDATPYSEEQDWPIRGFYKKEKAEDLVNKLEIEEDEREEDEGYRDSYYRISELEVE